MRKLASTIVYGLMNSAGEMIQWDRDKLKRFKAQYKANIKLKDKDTNLPLHNTFIFEDNEFVIGYAKYLIQYLEGILK